ncbi:hypothetical protein DPEC_G00174050 [Dallia pectoralis]|uniref:Uncharacterized protein n=1 Tax=Dallia pectoralis TaxID=75939 RepID=A0ACC2GEK6_DALPE|nr:hypothetical protein DPEC_G00174050 [Dallia pectoralis]
MSLIQVPFWVKEEARRWSSGTGDHILGTKHPEMRGPGWSSVRSPRGALAVLDRGDDVPNATDTGPDRRILPVSSRLGAVTLAQSERAPCALRRTPQPGLKASPMKEDLF